MSCCGGKIKADIDDVNISAKIHKIKNIIEGSVKEVIARRTGIDFKYAKERFAICENCENITWLKDREFLYWLKENKIDVLKKIDRLDELSDLPKMPHRAVTARDCIKCKCNILAKIHSKEEKCPEVKWR